jgi:hypothetical protein
MGALGTVGQLLEERIRSTHGGINDGGVGMSPFAIASTACSDTRPLHDATQRAGAEPLPVSALEAINRLRDDVDEVADFPLWVPEVIGTTLAAGVAFAAMAAIDLRLTIISAIPLLLPRYRRLSGFGLDHLRYRYAAGKLEDQYTSLLGSIIAAASLILRNSVPAALQRLHHITQQRQQVGVRGEMVQHAQAALVGEAWPSVVWSSIGMAEPPSCAGASV